MSAEETSHGAEGVRASVEPGVDTSEHGHAHQEISLAGDRGGYVALTTFADFTSDANAMRLALDQAQNALLIGEVPVGAVIMRAGQVIATGYNRPITEHDPTAHAEIVALRHAAHLLGNYRLPECEIFVTLEPCAMCAMALLHARFKRVVYGAGDPKTGAAGSVLDIFAEPTLNHHTAVTKGVLASASADLLRTFFKDRRAQHKLRQAARSPALEPHAVAAPSPTADAIPTGEAQEIDVGHQAI